MTSRRYDVAIVGAGPAGSATAYFLARSGLDVLLLDKAVFPRDKTCGDGVSPRALAVLDKMGLVPDLVSRGMRGNLVRLFSPDGRAVEAEIPPRPGLVDYCMAVPRFVLDDLIRQQAVSAGAHFEGGVHVQNVRRDGAEMEVIAAGGRRYRARLAVAATGASVSLLLASGILKKTPPMMVAARAYYENMRGLGDRVDFHFDGVPLPGYGWVFPVSETCANVGAGYFKTTGRAAQSLPASPKAALDKFLTVPHLREALNGAHQSGPVKGFPLRVDFATAPTYGDGVMLVGEACGLVNAFTGEGIDYALESAEIASDYIIAKFSRGDFSRRALKEYDRRLRRRFQRTFIYTARIRDFYMTRAWLLNRFLSLAVRRPELKVLLVDVALGNRDAADGVSLRTVYKVLRNV
jgi:geranylgeranyl reductase family protein